MGIIAVTRAALLKLELELTVLLKYTFRFCWPSAEPEMLIISHELLDGGDAADSQTTL